MLQNLPKRILTGLGHRMVNPDDIVEQLGVARNWQVLEMGRPVGYFANSLHRVISDEGGITIAGPTDESLEVLHEQVEHLQIQTTTLSRVLGGDAVSPNSLDLLIMTNLLSSVAHADNFCLSIDKYLKPTGKIAIIDWQQDPTSSTMADRIVTKEAAIKLLQSCNMIFDRMLDAAGYHYGLVFKLKQANEAI